jgi:hypothetical protein
MPIIWPNLALMIRLPGAELCQAGGEQEQIQVLLVRPSGHTTERHQRFVRLSNKRRTNGSS